LECGGKRSATPLLGVQEEIQSGVALRLPPHSKGLSFCVGLID
jgi:hypothetical protein